MRDGRVLLVHRERYDDWSLPKGKLEDGESWEDAALREVWEETGIRVSPEQLGEPVFDDVTEFPYEGVWYRQEQIFYRLRVEAGQLPPDGLRAAPVADEHAIHAYQWWSVDEMAASAEKIYPPDLAHRLSGLDRGAD